MDAIALLKSDHRNVEALFEKFESARGSDRKEALASRICTELVAHSTIEEEIFYPACQGEIEDELLDEAYVEHDGVKVLIAEIVANGPSDRFFEAKVKVLAEMIKHHVHEEEKRSEGMFAQARAAGLDVEALGERMAARKQKLLDEFQKRGLPTPLTRAYRGHALREGAPVEEKAEA